MIGMIYVACPPFFKTGGTELLHQMVGALNSNNIRSCIYYTNFNSAHEVCPTPASFKVYINENWVEKIDDSEENVLIVPEINTSLLNKYNKIKKCIWWLSVDGFFDYNVKPKYLLKLYASFYRNKLLKRTLSEYQKLHFNQMDVNFHLVQSYYAYLFLKSYNIQNIHFLSDYVNDLYLHKSFTGDVSLKENIVVYNPAKGYEITQKLKETAPYVNWVPIKGMTNTEVFALMNKAKVYIDFGHHPGKDRIPREAALAGCCVIVGKRGSAKNQYDIAIPDKYKFDTTDIRSITALISDILNNYSEFYPDFDGYRKKILDEKLVFGKQLNDFIQVLNLN